jgi:hypothetical protein
MAQQVAVGDHSHQVALVVDDRDVADAALVHRVVDLVDGIPGTHAQDLVSHQVSDSQDVHAGSVPERAGARSTCGGGGGRLPG